MRTEREDREENKEGVGEQEGGERDEKLKVNNGPHVCPSLSEI